MTPLETTALALAAAAVLLTYVVAYMVLRWWVGLSRKESIKFASAWPIVLFAVAVFAGAAAEQQHEAELEQKRLSDFE